MKESTDYRPLSGHKAFSTIVAWAIVTLVVAVIVIPFSTPAVVSKPATRRTVCLNNVRNIGLALLNYADTSRGNVFPPAYFPDQKQTALHSWRAAIVGFLDQPAVARKYRWDEAWNGPHNSRLAQELPVWGFHCPNDPDDALHTSYVVVVGANTLFPGTQSRGPKDIRRAGGAGDTILVFELPQSGVHWMQPVDLKYEDAVRGLGISGQPFSSVHPGGIGADAVINVCFADGHAQAIPLAEFAEFVKKHARIDDRSEPVPDNSTP